MKSIKTNPNSAKGPDKGKIVNKLHCILLTTRVILILFFQKKTDMKFIIIVSNLTQRFLLKKKEYIKKNYEYDAILSKYDSAEKRYINYAYVLKNGVGRFNIYFFYFYANLAESSCVVFAQNPSIFLFHNFFNKQFRTCANALPNEVTVQVINGHMIIFMNI